MFHMHSLEVLLGPEHRTGSSYTYMRHLSSEETSTGSGGLTGRMEASGCGAVTASGCSRLREAVW